MSECQKKLSSISKQQPPNVPSNQPILITTGEPAGIGMDIVLSLAATDKLSDFSCPIWVLADQQEMNKRWQALSHHRSDFKHQPKWKIAKISPEYQLILVESDNQEQKHGDDLDKRHKNSANDQSDWDFVLIDVPCQSPVEAGKLNVKNAAMVWQQLEMAHQLATNQNVGAIVTAPLQKSILIEAGLTLLDGSLFCGHTEYFMQRSGCDKVVMMLANTVMKVALVTTHLPLKQVADAVTAKNVQQTVQIVLDDMQQKFGITHPKILVCGLNPHAGENGHLGEEENLIINPVLREFQKNGVNISDALPADTLFTKKYLQDCDAIIAMYHDQGLPVLKSHGFGDTVNLTLGLPYIRTSVDHGTALDLAATGQADDGSLYQAIKMAQVMKNSLSKYQKK